MKLLLIGDFHGIIPTKLKKEIKKQEFDIILCTGDFCYSKHMRKIIFKNWGKYLNDFLPKEKFNKVIKKYVDGMQDPVEFLKKLNKPTFIVGGNADWFKNWTRSRMAYYVTLYSGKAKLKTLNERTKNSKLKIMYRKKVRFKDFILAGISDYYRPWNSSWENKRKKNNAYKKNLKKIIKKEDKPKILLAHVPPFNTKLDIINDKENPINGTHVGDKVLTKYIKKYNPWIVVCGHMHEHQKTIKLGKTLIINPGYAHDGQFATLDIEDSKIKSLRFFK